MTEGRVVYAIGDIHGRLDLLEALKAAIIEDVEAQGGARPLVVLVGDYVDRGPHSRGVIDAVLASRASRRSRWRRCAATTRPPCSAS